MGERDFKKLKEYYDEKTNPKPKPEPLMCEPGDIIASESGFKYYVLSGYGTELQVASVNPYPWIRIGKISTLNGNYTKSTKAPDTLIDFIHDKPSETFVEGMIVRARKGYKFEAYSRLDDDEMLELSNIAVVMKVQDPLIIIGVSLKSSGSVYTEIGIKKDLLVKYTEEDAKLAEIEKQKRMNECCIVL